MSGQVRRWGAALVVGAFAIGIAAAAPQPSALTIAVYVPRTGPAAAVGDAIRRGAELAVADARKRNPRLRVGLVVVDSSQPWSSGLRALADCRYANGLRIVVAGATNVDAHLVAQFVARERGDVLLLIPWASDPGLTRIPLPWVFRVSPDDRQQAEAPHLTDAAARSSSPAAGRFLRAYQRAYRGEPPPPAAFAYDALTLVCQASNGHDGDEHLRRALARTDFVGVTGRIHFDASGQRVY